MYAWAMSHIEMSRVPCMYTALSWFVSEPCPAYKSFVSHAYTQRRYRRLYCMYLWMSHVPHTNEVCPTYHDMSHTLEHTRCRQLQRAFMDESRPTFEWDMSHTRMRHVTDTNEFYLINSNTGAVSCGEHLWMSHVPQINETCPTYEWVMSHKYQHRRCRRLLQVCLPCRTWPIVRHHIKLAGVHACRYDMC